MITDLCDGRAPWWPLGPPPETGQKGKARRSPADRSGGTIVDIPSQYFPFYSDPHKVSMLSPSSVGNGRCLFNKSVTSDFHWS